jgi:hypothetical protein
MLRILQCGNSIPFSFPVDPTAEFLPGMAAQLKLIGNNIVCGVSDGTAPIGIIDDIKCNSFSRVSINEVILAGPITGTQISPGIFVSPYDLKVELDHPSIIQSSFVSNPVDCQLIANNGVVVFLAGTELNLDADNDGIPDSIRTVVNYTYFVPNVPGDDSTAGSKRVTVWFQRIIAETDQFDTTQRYPLNANLFINEEGKFTTRQPSEEYPGIGIITGPPNSIMGSLQFILL